MKQGKFMGLEKAIRSGKERRKEYHGAKAVDSACRNNGGVLTVNLIVCMLIASG